MEPRNRSDDGAARAPTATVIPAERHTPIEPIEPIEPTAPFTPVSPIAPIAPTAPLARFAPLSARTAKAVRERLRGFEVQPLPTAGHRHAAVALVLVEEGHGAEVPGLPRHAAWRRDGALLLTRRAADLARHAGQWALPGGRIDPGETPEQAARRELAEEVGLNLGADALLGRLDDYATRSGYVITPVLMWGGAAHALRPNPQEVAGIHRVPWRELLRADAPMLNQVRGAEHPVLRMPLGSRWIAAPTAAFLYQFREVVLCGRATRVAHFDQPRFAWR